MARGSDLCSLIINYNGWLWMYITHLFILLESLVNQSYRMIEHKNINSFYYILLLNWCSFSKKIILYKIRKVQNILWRNGSRYILYTWFCLIGELVVNCVHLTNLLYNCTTLIGLLILLLWRFFWLTSIIYLFGFIPRYNLDGLKMDFTILSFSPHFFLMDYIALYTILRVQNKLDRK